MLFEIFKNSMRAVMEHHDHDHSDKLPPLQVIIVQGKEDICVKVNEKQNLSLIKIKQCFFFRLNFQISDQGGGIPRTHMDHLFKYMYSTAPQPSKSDMHTVPLAGYGYGLPISRLYARYFHGDLVLMSCDGFGTDAVIYLKVNFKWFR